MPTDKIVIIELPRTLKATARGNKFKKELAAIIADLGYSVQIEEPYSIDCNAGPIKIDIVCNVILGIEVKIYMDTNMAYKYEAPIKDIITDNKVHPTHWVAICGQDAGGFAWLERHNISCLSFEAPRSAKAGALESVHVNLTTLKAFIDASTSI